VRTCTCMSLRFSSQSPRRAETRSGDARGVYARVAIAARLFWLNRDLSGAPMPFMGSMRGGKYRETVTGVITGRRCITGSREITFVAARTLLPRLCNYQRTSFRRE